MRVAFFLLVSSAVLVGCAHEQSAKEMGAAPAAETVCKDGKTLPPDSKCGLDKGVDRQSTGTQGGHS